MKTVLSALLILFMAGGFHAIAQETTAPAASAEDPANLPSVEETAKPAWTPPPAESRSDFKDNLYYGGYINLSFGSYTVIGVEPLVGYRLTRELSVGAKVRYNYIKDDRYSTSQTTSTYGGSVFGRYLITPNIYAQAEAASYNYERFFIGGGSERDWVPFLLLGGGYIQPLGDRTWLTVEILFDVLQDDKSPYDDWEPFFSIGVGVGF
jgi:hypothetical protein